MKNKFIWGIMLPLAIVTLLSFNLGLWKFGLFMYILLLDGLFGILRVIKHNVNKEKFHTSDMKIIENKTIPFGRYTGILLFGTLFTKLNASKLSNKYKEHEMIHKVQGFETGYILMYFIYLLEGFFWTIKLIITFPKWYFDEETKELKWYQKIKESVIESYSHICFEQEAYYGENLDDYKNNRLWYGWLRFLFNADNSKNN